MNPPRLARWLLQRALPYSDRAAIVGDLDEEFRSRTRAGRGASAWYWRQAIGSLPHALKRRAPRAEWLAADIHFTLRLWRRQPAFAAAVIATQATGIAVATTVLASAYAVLVRPLPYREPDRIVHLHEGTGRGGQLSYQDFLDIRRANRSLEIVAGYSGGGRTLTIPGAAPERLPMLEVSDGFFEVLGVAPALGRSFAAADTLRTAPPVAMLSHDSWTRRFGADPQILGKTINLGGIPHEVVGVLPRSFVFPHRGRPEIWVPQRPSVAQERRGYWHWIDGIARLRAGVSAEQLQGDLALVASLLESRDAKNHTGASLRAIPLRDKMVTRVKPTIRALLAGVVLLVLVTCATSATLLLSRTAPRRPELSLRSALGASRSRILFQLLTENLMLSLAGGAIGIAAGHWLLQLFAAGMPLQQRLVLPYFEHPGVDLTVAAAALIGSIGTGLLFGVGPALRAARHEPADALRTAAPGEARLRSWLVSLQVAVALILLSSAALLATSLHRLLAVPVVADPQGLITFRVNLPPKYTLESIRTFHRRLLEELYAAPGVTAAALINQAPLMGAGNNGTLHVSGRAEAPGERGPVVAIRTVSAGYFQAMRVPVVRGRSLTANDTRSSPQVVVINRLLADTVFRGSEPLGQRISFQFLPGEWEVVGVVDNERFDEVDRPLIPVVYFSTGQDATGSFNVMLRALDTGVAVATARDVVRRIDPDLPIFSVRTMEEMADESSAVFLRRAALWMLGTFAIASVLLAAMGLYGILAQSVADRTREIGVRVALGATRGRIARLVLRGAFAAVGAGGLLGVLGTLGASRWLSSLVFGVSTRDPLVIVGATTFLLVVALGACLVPARRALGVNPAMAVRE